VLYHTQDADSRGQWPHPIRSPRSVRPTALTTAATDALLGPALIADLGEPASGRYVDFFTANIRNANTRRT
jgi:hypothetical protein